MRLHGWALDPEVTYLNHGGFGAVPLSVMEEQRRWGERIERNPNRFMAREALDSIAWARARLSEFVGADPEAVAFVRNATAGVNAVVQSLAFDAGDRVVLTDHAYNACRNALDAVAVRHGLELVTVPIPLPVTGPEAVRDRVLEAVTPDTRLLLLDHVTSQTALVFPVEEIVPLVEEMGVPVLVDGAHAPGMVPLDLDRLGASFYAANLHKWVCAPRGSGFLHVRSDRRDGIVPPAISHGWNDDSPDRSRFHKLFDWTGTDDLTAWLSVPAALEALAGRPGGVAGAMERNHSLTMGGRQVLEELLGLPPVAPEAMVGSMAALRLPPGVGPDPGSTDDELGRVLGRRWKIEVPVTVFPRWPQRLIRISAQEYNTLDDFERLAEALGAELTGDPS
jgi:isopenicillin-N epimerase